MGAKMLSQKTVGVLYKNYLYRKRRFVLLILEPLLSLVLAILLYTVVGKRASGLFPIFLFISFFISILSIVGGIISEKETGFKELQKILGLPNWLQWYEWLVNALLWSFLSMFVLWLFSAFSIYPKLCDPGVLLLFFLTCSFQALTFAFFLSSFFQKHTMAMALIRLLWISFTIAQFVLPSLISGDIWRASLPYSVLPPYSILLNCYQISTDFYETGYRNASNATKIEISWDNLFTSIKKDEFGSYPSFGAVMWGSSVGWLLLAVYIENVLPKKFGVRLPCGNVECRKYSGGMKRRLSAGMALIGQPPILMLDEPTSGVDPISRRLLWKIFSSSTQNSGQSIILTSHSMEECEDLCSSLCIMVNGAVQCTWTVEHLKNKFALGFCLIIKVDQKAVQVVAREQIFNLIIKNFPPSKLLDENQSIMQFQLLNTQLGWDVLFTVMETIKNGDGAEFIDDYFVTETSLEQIFLQFARGQYPERESRKGCSCC